MRGLVVHILNYPMFGKSTDTIYLEKLGIKFCPKKSNKLQFVAVLKLQHRRRQFVGLFIAQFLSEKGIRTSPQHLTVSLFKKELFPALGSILVIVLIDRQSGGRRKISQFDLQELFVGEVRNHREFSSIGFGLNVKGGW